MVATFTPQKELQERAFIRAAGPQTFPDQRLYPAAQFRGAVLYEGRIRVTTTAGVISFELLDGTYAGAGISPTDEIFVETESGNIVGAWTVGTVADPSAEVTPLDPPEAVEVVQLDGTQVAVDSYDTQRPNLVRGAVDQTVDAVVSGAIELPNVNLRSRGTSGQWLQGASDNIRQLTFDGPITGGWDIGSAAIGATSGAVGTVVGLSPGISQGGSGHWLLVDMGVDYAGFEYTLGEVVDGSGANPGQGTLRADALGARSFSPLDRERNAPEIVAAPPLQANLLHWFDFADPSQVFADTAGTIAATEGVPIERINNKGTDGTPITKAGPNVPEFRTNVINGLSVARTTVSGNTLASVIAAGIPLGGGVTAFAVWKRAGGAPLAEERIVEWDQAGFDLHLAHDQVNRINGGGGGTSFLGSGGGIAVDNNFVWHYFVRGVTGGTCRHRSAASGVEATAACAGFPAINPATTLQICEPVGDVAEILIYDLDFAPAQLALLTSYANLRYDNLPKIVP